MTSRGIFTLGGALTRVWHPAYPLLPWALSSALLMTAGLWDFWSRGGPIDWVVVGLSAYELAWGLLEESPTSPVRHQSRPSPVSISKVDA